MTERHETDPGNPALDWDARYIVSRSLAAKILPTGKLGLLGPALRKPQELESDALPVLLGFASGATPREVLGRLQEEWDLEEDGFQEVVQALVEQRVLEPVEPADGTRKARQALGFGLARNHLGLLKDALRVMSYRTAIERHARDRTVVEIGCGTGILSVFAARAGARRVIAIEETEIADLAARMFAANGCSGTIDLRNANSRFVELDEPADLIIHEILGVDPFEENILPVLEDARRRLLRPEGRFLPSRLEVCCLGVELTEPPPDEERTLAEARELSGLYGLDVEPLVQSVAESFRESTSRRSWNGGQARFEPKILSEEHCLLDLDFRSDPLDLSGWTAAVPLRITRAGTLSGVVLFFRAHLDEQIELTTSPYAPPTHWGWDVRAFSKYIPVAAGDEVALTVEIQDRAGTQGLMVRLAES